MEGNCFALSVSQASLTPRAAPAVPDVVDGHEGESPGEEGLERHRRPFTLYGHH